MAMSTVEAVHALRAEFNDAQESYCCAEHDGNRQTYGQFLVLVSGDRVRFGSDLADWAGVFLSRVFDDHAERTGLTV